MGPTKSPVHWLPGFFPGGKAVGPWGAAVKERVQWVLMAGYRVKFKVFYIKIKRAV
jgi:hypothetical protein